MSSMTPRTEPVLLKTLAIGKSKAISYLVKQALAATCIYKIDIGIADGIGNGIAIYAVRARRWSVLFGLPGQIFKVKN